MWLNSQIIAASLCNICMHVVVVPIHNKLGGKCIIDADSPIHLHIHTYIYIENSTLSVVDDFGTVPARVNLLSCVCIQITMYCTYRCWLRLPDTTLLLFFRTPLSR